MEQRINMQSDASNYGSSSLEFIIPPKQQQHQTFVDVCAEHNIKPSDHTTEADFRGMTQTLLPFSAGNFRCNSSFSVSLATAATRRLNIPDIEGIRK